MSKFIYRTEDEPKVGEKIDWRCNEYDGEPTLEVRGNDGTWYPICWLDNTGCLTLACLNPDDIPLPIRNNSIIVERNFVEEA